MNRAEPVSKLDFHNGEALTFRDAGQISEYALQMWLRISEAAIMRNGFFTAALSGGESPIPFYRRLSTVREGGCWDKSHIFLVDERFVPYESGESNYRMIRETLLDHVSIPETHVHPIRTDSGTPQSAAREYEKELTSFFRLQEGGIPVFDMVLLGMGSDGHTASLFPGTPAASETERLAVGVMKPDGLTKERVSITFPVINHAGNIVFIISGADKAGAVRDVLERADISLPASHVDPSSGALVYLLDEPASRLLGRQGNT